jgi:membrane protease YdiL (CAAX protease family)
MIEELLFRGVLQGELLRFDRLAKPFAGVTAANVVVSGLFGAIHLVNQSPGWALAIVIPSLVFGYFRDRSSSVIPGLVLHVAYNGVFFLVQS